MCYAGYATQSITVEFDRRSCSSLCFTCLFASWSKDQITCDADIQFVEPYSEYAPYENTTDTRQTCFSDLPCDRRYIVNITVGDGRLTLYFVLLGGTSNKSTSSDKPNNPASGDNPRKPKPLSFCSCTYLIFLITFYAAVAEVSLGE